MFRRAPPPQPKQSNIGETRQQPGAGWDRKNQTRPGTSSGEKVAYLNFPSKENPFKYKKTQPVQAQTISITKNHTSNKKLTAPTHLPGQGSSLLEQSLTNSNKPVEKCYTLRISPNVSNYKHMVAKWPRYDFKHPLSQLKNWRNPSSMTRDCKNVPYTDQAIPGLRKIQDMDDNNEPIYGKGSEYRKRQKDKQRAIKKGYSNKRKIDVNDLPIDLKLSYEESTAQPGSSNAPGQKPKLASSEFIGTREHTNENSMYFAFYMSSNAELHACPVDSSYTFKKKINYKTISIDDADELWEKRDKILDLDAFMVNHRKKESGNEGNFTSATQNSLLEKMSKLSGQDREDSGKSSGGRRGKSDTGLNLIEKHSDEDDSGSDFDDENTKRLSKLQKTSEKSKKRSAKMQSRGGITEDNEGFEQAHDEKDDGDDEEDEIDYESDKSSDFEKMDDGDRERDIKGFGENTTKVNLNEKRSVMGNAKAGRAGNLSDSDDDLIMSEEDDDSNVPSSSSEDQDEDEDSQEDEVQILVGARSGIPLELLEDPDSISSGPDSAPNSNIPGMEDENSRGSSSFGIKRANSPADPSGQSAAKRPKMEIRNDNKKPASRGSTPTPTASASVIPIDYIRKCLRMPIPTNKLIKKLARKYTSMTSESIVEDIKAAFSTLKRDKSLQVTNRTLPNGKQENLYYVS